jgi:hypothetical protein
MVLTTFCASSVDMPALLRSLWQPVVMFWAAWERVALLQEGEPQTDWSQLLTGWIIEVLAVVSKILMALKICRQLESSEFASALLRVVWHCSDSLSSGMSKW